MVSYIEICEKIRQCREAASANVLSQRLTWNVLEIKKKCLVWWHGVKRRVDISEKYARRDRKGQDHT